jgi:hypothetical protein
VTLGPRQRAGDDVVGARPSFRPRFEHSCATPRSIAVSRWQDAAMPLPAAADVTTLVIRTDFSDDAAWSAFRLALDAQDECPAATYVDDPRFAGATIEALVAEEAAAGDDDKACEVFLADAVALGDPAYPLLAVDLYAEPGRTFRVPIRWFPEISVNLSIANLDFADYADTAGPTGVFDGFGGSQDTDETDDMADTDDVVDVVDAVDADGSGGFGASGGFGQARRSAAG